MKFWKTTIQVEVLSECTPIGGHETLEEICNFITTGGGSGTHKIIETKVLTPSQAAQELIKQGSDPEFFGLDKNGNDIED